MSSFNLQQWLDDQFEHNVLLESVDLTQINAVEVRGFGFPHYAEAENDDFSSPAVNYFLHL